MYPRSSNSTDSFETAFPGIRSWARCKVRVLFTNSSGAAAIEYSVLAASIAVAIIVAVTGLGTQVTTLYDEVVVAVGATEPGRLMVCRPRSLGDAYVFHQVLNFYRRFRGQAAHRK